MPDLHIFDLQIPPWVPIFVMAGIGLVVVAVPLRLLWKATKSLRARGEKLDQFADRLRERFNEVSQHRGLLGPSSISFKHERRRVSVTVHGLRSVTVRLDETPTPKFACVITTNRRFLPPATLAGLRLLPRIRTFDSLLDDAVAIYATPVFGAFLRDMIADAITIEGKPSGLVESLICLRRLSGVRRFRLWTAPEGAMAVRLSLRTEDFFFRADQVESVVHHMGTLYDKIVKY
jgi:hypothetical protein